MKLYLHELKISTEWDFDKNSETDFATISSQSSRKVWWKCDKGHNWEARIASRSQGSNCPVCGNRKVLAGFNDLVTTHPELASEWHFAKNVLTSSEVIAGSTLLGWWIGSCGHEWQASLVNRSKGKGCPVCSNKTILVGFNDLVTTHPDIVKEWHPTKNDSLAPEQFTKGSKKKIVWLGNCSHIWEASIADRTKGRGCPVCAGKQVVEGYNDLDGDLMLDWHPTLNLPLQVSAVSKMSGRKVWWKCSKSHEWEAMVANRVKGANCPFCSGIRAKSGFNDITTTHPDLASQWHPTKNGLLQPADISAGSQKLIWWLGKCQHEWAAYPYNRKKTGCPECNKANVLSQGEVDILSYLKDLGLIVEQSNRQVLANGKEVDLYVPKQMFAIEFNGIYWHNENHKHKFYHKDKYEAAKTAGINLIQIWEDDWRDRKPIILRALAHKLGKTSELARLYPELETVSAQIYARKTRVVEVTTAEARTFLSSNHVQGFAAGSYYLGLEDPNGILRALMVLRKERNNTLNIIRYATAGSVTGGFTKLLKHAERVYQPSAFITFADHAISDGGLYENNGFVADKELPPDYMYVVKGERKHKFGYRLKKFRDDPTLLWDENMSERELALLNNIPRIWDAGKTRYRKELK
jgi:hypothetical protein